MMRVGAVVAMLWLAGCAVGFDPERRGLTCVDAVLCLDDLSREAEARALYDEALGFVEAELGPFEARPVVGFCSTRACFAEFSDPAFRGVNFGLLFNVINEHGWQPHIVRHEMIHHWQHERFGRWRMRLFFPPWYVEGMAYTLSEDPRAVLPLPELQAQRAEFQRWVAAGGDWRAGPF